MLKSLIDAVMCKRRNNSSSVQLPQKRVKREYECPICKGTITTALVTECGHKFCSTCIEIHLDHKKKCPICRKDLTGSILGPGKEMVLSQRNYFTVNNGVKCPYSGMEIIVRDENGNWNNGIVKLVIPNGDKFPLLLVAHGGKDLVLETISQDSLRIRTKVEDSKKEVKEKNN